MDIEDSPTPIGENPFASLAKRPKPLHSDRPDDALDATDMMGESERQLRLLFDQVLRHNAHLHSFPPTFEYIRQYQCLPLMRL